MEELSLNMCFDSWAHVESYVAWLKAERFVPIVKRSRRSVKCYNKQLREIGKQIDETKWEIQSMRFECSHYGMHKSRAKDGVNVEPRRHQKVFKNGCKFFFRVVLDPNAEKYFVSGLEVKHTGHKISVSHKKIYCRKKNIPAEILDVVSVALQTGANTGRVRDYILENSGVELKTKDVTNIKATLQERNGSGLEDTLVYLEKLKSDSRNIVRVTEKDGIVSSIYIQLHEQREMFKKFGDVLLLDATHNTNHANMALCTLLVTDSYGKGQPVAYYFASKETIVIHLVCLSLFKETNDISGVIAILTDKDAKEIAAIGEIFPKAKALLCWFHVHQAVDRHLMSCGLEVNLKQQVKEAFCTALNTKSELVLMGKMEYLCSLEKSGLGKYFKSIWFSCAESWTTIGRLGMRLLDNNTTNRLERFHRTLKDELGGEQRLTGIIRIVVAVCRARARDLLFKDLESDVRYSVDRPCFLLMPFEKVLTVPIFELLEKEASLPKNSYNSFEDVEHYSLSTNIGTYFVKKDLRGCSCTFFSHYGLPCRHIMYFAAELYVALTPEMFTSRWNVDAPLSESQNFIINDSMTSSLVVKEPDMDLLVASIECKKRKSKSPEESYCEAMNVFKDIAGTLSELPATVADGYTTFFSESHKRMRKNISLHSSTIAGTACSSSTAETFLNSLENSSVNVSVDGGDGSSGLRLDSSVKRSGRPRTRKGVNRFNTGPKAFSSLPLASRVLAFLSWVMPTEAVPNDIEGLKVSPEMLMKDVGDMNNAIIESEIDEDLDSYRFVFTEGAWSSLLNLIAEKRDSKKSLIYNCGVCSSKVGRGASVLCNACLQWMHLRCGGFSKKKMPESLNVFCSKCRKSAK